jgi:flavin-dependent dehydrogenase
MAAAAQLPGRRVLVLERHDSVVNKHRGCLGLLLPIGERVEVRGENLFLHGQDLFVEGGVRQRFNRLELRGKRERTQFELPRPLVLINEGRLKGALLRRIREIGAEVRVGSAVRDVDTDGREARVRTDEEHQARVLLGTDGSNSIVRRSLGYKREKSAVLFQRELKLSQLDVPAETLHIQMDNIRNLFFAFGLGDAYLASVMQVVGVRQVPGNLEDHLVDQAERLGAGRTLAARGAVVRLFSPATFSYRQNVILAGDALATYGLASITGALTMGALAGRAIHRFLAGSRYALPEYHGEWRKLTIQSWTEKLRWIMPVLSRIDADRLDRMLRASRGGNDRSAAANLVWRIPAILMRLFV